MGGWLRLQAPTSALAKLSVSNFARPATAAAAAAHAGPRTATVRPTRYGIQHTAMQTLRIGLEGSGGDSSRAVSQRPTVSLSTMGAHTEGCTNDTFVQALYLV